MLSKCSYPWLRRGFDTIAGWYNAHRPNSGLLGRTPDEVYFGQFPANRRPRVEPRPVFPRGSPCAMPIALVAGKPGTRFDSEVKRLGGHMQLAIIRLRRAENVPSLRSKNATLSMRAQIN